MTDPGPSFSAENQGQVDGGARPRAGRSVASLLEPSNPGGRIARLRSTSKRTSTTTTTSKTVRQINRIKTNSQRSSNNNILITANPRNYLIGRKIPFTFHVVNNYESRGRETAGQSFNDQTKNGVNHGDELVSRKMNCESAEPEGPPLPNVKIGTGKSTTTTTTAHAVRQNNIITESRKKEKNFRSSRVCCNISIIKSISCSINDDGGEIRRGEAFGSLKCQHQDQRSSLGEDENLRKTSKEAEPDGPLLPNSTQCHESHNTNDVSPHSVNNQCKKFNNLTSSINPEIALSSPISKWISVNNTIQYYKSKNQKSNINSALETKERNSKAAKRRGLMVRSFQYVIVMYRDTYNCVALANLIKLIDSICYTALARWVVCPVKTKMPFYAVNAESKSKNNLGSKNKNFLNFPLFGVCVARGNGRVKEERSETSRNKGIEAGREIMIGYSSEGDELRRKKQSSPMREGRNKHVYELRRQKRKKESKNYKINIFND